jgi:molybdopterin molybdotransferase
MQENAERADDGAVSIRVTPEPGDNVRKRASDLARGALALARGSLIGPGEIALLAGLDTAQVTVTRRPRVAILTTGDELRGLGELARPGSIVNSNAYALAAAIAQSGAEPIVLPPARDRLDELTARVREGLAADLLLTVGGVSVGDYDLTPQALREAGVEVTFHKVAVKPGKPILFGVHADRKTPVVGLPGNPVSALVTFEVFVRPGLSRMLGHARPFAQRFRVQLAEAYTREASRTELARARLEPQADGWLARLQARQGSGSLPAMAGCDALVILPRGVAHHPAGSTTWAVRIGDPPRSATPAFDD